ncbi:MAG: leucine-rich repeat domain-containing protein [Treponema sp.]|nr:leucine-rich repeat domain-containing protein [Treponema sp.]
MGKKFSSDMIQVFGNSISEKMDNVADAIREEGEKQSKKFEEVNEKFSAQGQINNMIINSVSELEQKVFYGLEPCQNIQNLENTERKILVNILFYLANKEPANDIQKKYIRSVTNSLGIGSGQADFDLSYIDNIDSNNNRKIMLQSVMEYLFLKDSDFSFLQDDNFIEIKNFFNLRDDFICTTQKNILSMATAIGNEGIAEKNEIIEDEPFDEEIEKNYTSSNEIETGVYREAEEVVNDVPGVVKLGTPPEMYGAFEENTEITEMIIPEGIRKIAPRTFLGCSNLSKVILPKSLKIIGEMAFEGCESLKSIEIPYGVKVIEASAFKNCKNLYEINISQGIKTISNSCFENCEKLSQVNIPDSVISIEEYAFYGCKYLEQIKIPETVEEIGNHAFSCCSSLRNINLPATLKIIESNVFYGCESIEMIQIPSTVKTIGESAFYGCSYLKDINFGNGLLEIGEHAFGLCSSLKSIVLPESLKLIKDFAFDHEDFKDIEFLGNIPPKISNYVFSPLANISITVPSDYYQRYINEYAEKDDNPFQHYSSWRLPKSKIHKEKSADIKIEPEKKKGLFGKIFG